jgi:tight adherence protein B
MGTVGILVVFAGFLSAFFGIFTINLILVDLFQREREETLQRLNEELLAQQRQRAREKTATSSKDPLSEILADAGRDAHQRKHIWDRLEELTMQSGLRITTTKLMTICGLTGLLVSFLAYGLSRNLLAAGLIGGVFAAIPLLYVSYMRHKRLETLRSQLPDAFELMSRILRAGQSVTQAMQAVSEEFSPPVNVEFGYCYEQQNLGLSPEIALHELAQRTGLMEVKIFVLAVLVHRQAGGNLTGMLDNIAHVVRQRFKMRREIKSLTSEGRLQAIVLLSLPIGVWIGLYFITRDYAMALIEHSTLLVITLASMLIGTLWIRRIVNFDF